MSNRTHSLLFAIGFGFLFELLTIESYYCAGIGPATLIMVISTAYYTLTSISLLINTHNIIASKVYSLILIGLNLVLNPLLLYYFALFFTSPLNNNFLLFYAPTGNTLLFLLNSLVLRYCESKYEQRRINIKFADYCQCCGKGLDPLTAHCPYCYSLSHKFSETLSAFPNKHNLDFTVDIYRDSKYCPHCGASKGRRSWFSLILHSPLCVCTKCHYFYLDNSYVEWCLASPLRKCLILLTYLLVVILLLIPLWNALHGTSSIRLLLIFTGIVLLSLGFAIRILLNDIAASYRRLNATPDYSQLLKFMGYQHLYVSHENNN